MFKKIIWGIYKKISRKHNISQFKGLYKKTRLGLTTGFTGINNPYEDLKKIQKYF